MYVFGYIFPLKGGSLSQHLRPHEMNDLIAGKEQIL